MDGTSKFNKNQIARLVLGYLKTVNCSTACNAFVRESKYFSAEEKQSPEYLLTRVGGYSLIDILVEYAQINMIVQRRLEPTSFYKQNDFRSSLLEKLIYLLDKIQYSRPSTPRSPESVSVCTTIDNDSSDADATPIQSLPGNKRCHSDNIYQSKTPRRKLPARQVKSESLESYPTPEKDEISEVLTQTLLGNKELHEKLAETINTVLNTPEVPPKGNEKKNDKVEFTNELDATIKTVVQKTEEDPIFEKLLGELMGMNETGASCSTTTTNFHNRPVENQKSLSKTSENSMIKGPEKTYLNEHNAEAVQNLMFLAQSERLNNNPSKNEKIGNVSNSEIIVFDGSLENYLKSSSMPNTSCNNSIIVSPSKPLLLLTPQPPVVTSSSIITKEDILAMPTVIVNDSPIKQQKPINNNMVTSATSNPASTNNGAPVITNPISVVQVPVKKEVKKDRKGIGGRRKSQQINRNIPPPPILPAPSPMTAVVFSGFQTIEPLNQVPCLPKELGLQPISDSVKGAVKSLDNMKSLKTPAKQIENSIQKITPKSGSHVRNLNFSTPPKLRTSEMKTRSQTSASPKKDDTKCDNLNSKSESSIKNQKLTWDADLRALAGVVSTTSDSAQKRKRRSPIKSRKKMKKSNVSAQETKMLEDALKSPEKSLKSTENITLLTNSVEKSLKITEKALKVTEDNVKIDEPAKSSKSIASSKKKKQPKGKDISNKGNNEIEDKKNVKETTEKMIVDDAEKESILNLVTPELPKDPIVQPINKACRNIMPMLETPIKYDSLPKTPGLISPSNLTSFTPYNKILEAELGSVDLASINTPNIPITPNFPPITPNIISPYANRPTDYSTSSSYYIPSDSEQNKGDTSLRSDGVSPEKIDEILIKECQRLESLDKSEEKIKILSNIVIQKESVSVNNHLKAFNKNIIGKKNLSLVSRRSNTSSSSDSDTEEMECENTTVWDESQSNTTVICPTKNEIVSSYSLRNRAVNKNVEKTKETDTEIVKNILNSTQIKLNLNSHSKRKNQNQKEEVLKELEEKRRRTINKFKSSPKPTPKRNNKSKNLKVIVNKVSPVRTINKVNKRKSNSPRKSVPKNYSEDENDDIPTIFRAEDKNKSASDVEAENLIHGLKERGIHLMQNKTPKKNADKSNESKTSLEKLKEDLDLTEDSVHEDDPVFDNKVYEQEDFSSVYDPKNVSGKKMEDYDTSILNKIMDADINGCKVSITCTKFECLLDIPSEINILIPKKHKTVMQESNVAKDVKNNVEIICDSPAGTRIDPSENDLMNYAVVGSVREENSDDGIYSPRNSKKNKKDEKQCVEIIRKINVDAFLNSVHGEN